MEITRTRAELRDKLEGKKNIGFVPTMGALHRGHASLVERAVGDGGVVVVSVFVNPTQFNDPSDLKNYPRTERADLQMLEKLGADIVFAPSVEEIYPETDTRMFDLGAVAEVMEGASRPGHFNGVCQVVSRLFDLVQPERAYFGEKDFQQIAVIRTMVSLLGYDVEIVECPIVREADGLAMSSRNALLTAEYRAVAPEIYRALNEASTMTDKRSVGEVKRWVTSEVERNGLLKVLYFEIADSDSLQPVTDWTPNVRGFIAVQAGNVRLIDNIRFNIIQR